MTEKILQQGAEALIILKDKEIIKRRIKKSYRLPQIDEEIRKLRTRTEGKLLEKASKIIDVPKVKKVDEKTKEIVMDFVNGKKLSNFLDSFTLEKQKTICKTIGEEIAKLHDENIIHGDLTTSNMIYVSNDKPDKRKRGDKNINEIEEDVNVKNRIENNDLVIKNGEVGGVNNGSNFKIFFIDFGLGFHSRKIEDKAVDLHLLRQALEAKHFRHWQVLFDEFLKGYSISKHDSLVKMQFRKVEARGRYKERY